VRLVRKRTKRMHERDKISAASLVLPRREEVLSVAEPRLRFLLPRPWTVRPKITVTKKKRREREVRLKKTLVPPLLLSGLENDSPLFLSEIR